MNKNKIKVKNIKSYAYHGCLKEENIIGTTFYTDVIITTDFYKASLEDKLNYTIDYEKITNIVKYEMSIPSQLIENVAYRIIEHCKNEFNNLQKIKIEIKKINPPIQADITYTAIIIKEDLKKQFK